MLSGARRLQLWVCVGGSWMNPPGKVNSFGLSYAVSQAKGREWERETEIGRIILLLFRFRQVFGLSSLETARIVNVSPAEIPFKAEA